MTCSRSSVCTLLAAVVGLGALASLSAGCDSHVTPVLGTDQPFTLFGVVSPQLDTQRVLVFPIQDRLEQLTDAPLDASFTWRNLETGQVESWRDSLLRQPDGTFVHLFWLAGAATFGATYEMRVVRSDALESRVSLHVPPESLFEIQAANTVSGVIIPILVRGEIPNLLKVELEYGFDYTQTSPGQKLESLVLPYDTQASRVAGGWLIQVNLARDYRTILDFIRSQRAIELGRGVQLRGIQLRFLAASADWLPPGGVFDPEVLVEPGTMSNVTNGFGFVGAGYRTSTSWLPADSIANAAGFRQE